MRPTRTRDIIMKRTMFAAMSVLVLLLFVGCDRRQVRINQDNLLHSGKLRGYAVVYIPDFDNETFIRDNNSSESIGFPVYEKEGNYTIEYRDEEYNLNKLEEPVLLPGTDLSYLKYEFGDGYYIEKIPTSN